MGSFDDVAQNAATNSLPYEQVKKYLKIFIQSKNAYDPTRLRTAMASLAFLVDITDPSALVITYCTDSFQRSESIGYENFMSENPKHMNNLLLDRVGLTFLQTNMEKRLKVEVGLSKKMLIFLLIVW